MESICVWTRQRGDVLQTLMNEGRYTARRRYRYAEPLETPSLLTEAQKWLSDSSPLALSRPADADCPIWLSLTSDSIMPPQEGAVLMKLRMDKELITPINILKWGAVMNYSYIPADAGDAKRHLETLSACGTSDARAVMTPFYPQLKREIQQSWRRLFDESVSLGSSACYGIVWELRREWLLEAVHY